MGAGDSRAGAGQDPDLDAPDLNRPDPDAPGAARPASGPPDGGRPARAVLTVSADGPYLLSGPVEIRTRDGHVVPAGAGAALCRCGRSSTKPFCDGSHAGTGFSDPGVAPA